MSELESCFGELPPPPPPPPLAEDLTCSELTQCVGGCHPDDVGCVDTCYSDADPNALQEFFDVINCAVINGCEVDPECILASCGAESLNECTVFHCAAELETCFGFSID